MKTDDLWADFEGALGKINIEAMCQPYIIDNFLDINGAYDEDAGAAEIYMSAEMAVEPILFHVDGINGPVSQMDQQSAYQYEWTAVVQCDQRRESIKF